MKKLLPILALALCSCGARRFCQPSKRSGDYAYKVTNIKPVYQVTMWRTWGAERTEKKILVDCLPDGVKVGDTLYFNKKTMQ